MALAGYNYLKAYQFLVIIDQLTNQFCPRFLPSKENLRLRDQMIQAARSSKQCLVEGYTQASLKGYIYLTGIAQGSNEELRLDYQDYLHHHQFPIWDKSHFKLQNLSWVSRVCGDIAQGNIPTIPTIPTDPTHAANLILDLTIKAGFLLSKLLTSLKQKHKTEGGLTENLYKARKQYRGY